MTRSKEQLIEELVWCHDASLDGEDRLPEVYDLACSTFGKEEADEMVKTANKIYNDRYYEWMLL